MRRAAAPICALLLTVAACGGEEVPAAPADRADVERDVSRVAEHYYDAFRAKDLAGACGFVAPETLPSHVLVGVNVADGESPELDPPRPREGCDLVRARRRRWTEPVPRDRWRVEQVHLDRSRTRARVDPNGEGTYWMRKGASGWRIVGFEALTERGLRLLGGDWPPGALDGP